MISEFNFFGNIKIKMFSELIYFGNIKKKMFVNSGISIRGRVPGTFTHLKWSLGPPDFIEIFMKLFKF